MDVAFEAKAQQLVAAFGVGLGDELRVRAVAKACCEAYMAEVAGVNENADQEGEVA